MALLVQVGQFLQLVLVVLCVLQQACVDEVAHKPALADVEGPEGLASVQLCVNDVPVHIKTSFCLVRTVPALLPLLMEQSR